MEDEDRVLKLRNELEELILSATGRAPDRVERLARKAGIKDPPDAYDVGVSVTIIVHEKARDPRVLLSLLTYLPDVCDDFERKKLSDQLNRLINEAKKLFPEVRQVPGTGPRMGHEDRVLKLCNDLEALILSATGRAPDRVERLARKAGIKDPPDAYDVGVSVTIIVHDKARNPKVLLNLLTYLPTVCDYLEKRDITELNRLVNEAEELFPESRQEVAAGSPVSRDPASETEALSDADVDRGSLEESYSHAPPLHGAETPSMARTTGSASGQGADSGVPESVDVLLIVAAEVEREAVLSAFEKAGRGHVRKFMGVNSYWIYPSEGTSVGLVQCRKGSGGSGGSTLTAAEAIAALSPGAVVMPGIAFGVDPKKQHIGDVLVSTQILNYELRRMGTDEAGELVERTRGARPDASPRLLDRFMTARLTRFGLTIQDGLLLSGDKLVDNIDYRTKLQSFEPEAIGGEMEGAGIYAAAHRSHKDWILVKAICDFADGNKRRNKAARQKRAADAAAQAVMHVLEEGGLAPMPGT